MSYIPSDNFQLYSQAISEAINGKEISTQYNTLNDVPDYKKRPDYLIYIKSTDTYYRWDEIGLIWEVAINPAGGGIVDSIIAGNQVTIGGTQDNVIVGVSTDPTFNTVTLTTQTNIDHAVRKDYADQIQTNLTTHINSTTAHEAGKITTNTTGNYIVPSNVQSNLASLDGVAKANNDAITAHINSTTAHTDINLVNTPGTRVYAVGANMKVAIDTLDLQTQTNTTGVSTNATNLSNHLSSLSAHFDSALVNTSGTRVYATGGTIKTALDGLDGQVVTNTTGISTNGTNLTNHINSSTAHPASAITTSIIGNYINGSDVQTNLVTLDGRAKTNNDAITNHVINANNPHATSIAKLTDCDTTTIAPNATDVLGYNGTKWVPSKAFDNLDITPSLLFNSPLDSLITGDTQTQDTSTYGLVGTLTNLGLANLVAGKLGNAIQFLDVANQYIQFPYASYLDFVIENMFTINLWFKSTLSNINNYVLCGCGTGTNNAGWFLYAKGNTGTISFQLSDSTSTRNMTVDYNFGTGIWNDNNWHMLTITHGNVYGGHKAVDIKLYLDGVLREDVKNVVSDNLLVTDNIQSGQTFYIGNLTSGFNSLRLTTIDNLSIFNFKMQDLNVTSLYNSGTGTATYTNITTVLNHTHNVNDIINLSNLLTSHNITNDSTGRTYITGVTIDNALDNTDAQLVTLNTNKVDTITNTDAYLTITGTGNSRTINISSLLMTLFGRSTLQNSKLMSYNSTITSSAITTSINSYGSMTITDSRTSTAWDNLIVIHPDHPQVPMQGVSGNYQSQYFAIRLIGAGFSTSSLKEIFLGFTTEESMLQAISWGTSDFNWSHGVLWNIGSTTSLDKSLWGRLVTDANDPTQVQYRYNNVFYASARSGNVVDTNPAQNDVLVFYYNPTTLTFTIEWRKTSVPGSYDVIHASGGITNPDGTISYSSNWYNHKLKPIYSCSQKTTTNDYDVRVLSERECTLLNISVPNCKNVFY